MPKAHNIASTAVAFDQAYNQTNRPPWDTDGPTPFVEELERSGGIRGSVLDAGCGTGENSLFLAARQHTVVGLDGSPAAIEKAQLKAKDRHLSVTFQVADARDLAGYEACFGTMIDSGLFHVFDRSRDRLRYANALRRASTPGAMLHLLAFRASPASGGTWLRRVRTAVQQAITGFGTHPVAERELRRAFSHDWCIEAIDERTYGGLEFLLARIRRT